MGLFASRAQEPFEWAGLPSEPLMPRSNAEYLEDPPDDPYAIVPGATAASITISVVPAVDATRATAAHVPPDDASGQNPPAE